MYVLKPLEQCASNGEFARLVIIDLGLSLATFAVIGVLIYLAWSRRARREKIRRVWK